MDHFESSLTHFTDDQKIELVIEAIFLLPNEKLETLIEKLNLLLELKSK